MLLLIIASLILVACSDNNTSNQGNNENNNEETKNNANEPQNNNTHDEDNQEGNITSSGKSYDIDTNGLIEIETDVNTEIDQILAYYDSIHYPKPGFIDVEENISSISASARGESAYDYEVSILYRFEDKDDSLYVNIQSSDLLYTLMMKRKDDDNRDTKQIKDDLYFHKDNYTWKLDDIVYRLSMDDVEDDEAELAVSMYDNMVETNNELDKHEAFYREATPPTQIPEGYELLDTTLQLNNRTKLPPASINFLYYHPDKDPDSEESIVSVLIEGEYDEAPTLNKDAETFQLNDITYQTDGVFLLFTLDEKTYSINGANFTTEQLLGIAQSIIDQHE